MKYIHLVFCKAEEILRISYDFQIIFSIKDNKTNSMEERISVKLFPNNLYDLVHLKLF